jgi:hypothetical protein
VFDYLPNLNALKRDRFRNEARDPLCRGPSSVLGIEDDHREPVGVRKLGFACKFRVRLPEPSYYTPHASYP